MTAQNALRNIKLVVFDLDGTLVDDNDSISEEIKEQIKKLSKMGVQFSIATGRILSATTYHADTLDIKIPLITLDGTLIQRSPSDPIIFTKPLRKSQVKRAVELAEKHFLKIALCHNNAVYYTEEHASVTELLDKLGANFEQIFDYSNYYENTLEIVVASDIQENIKLVTKKMMFPYTYGIRAAYYKSSKFGGTYYLEIRRLGCSKGEGLKKLAKHLNIELSHTAVVGDWYNDKSMFEQDVMKIAVANAVPEIKRMADFVTQKNNNEGGVAEFLNLLLKAKM